MKFVVVVGHGMADEPMADLSGKTPLEVARTPHLDHLAARGILGLTRTIPRGLAPASEVGTLAVLGYDPAAHPVRGSSLEAVSLGAELGADDVAFRLNLVTLETVEGREVMRDFCLTVPVHLLPPIKGVEEDPVYKDNAVIKKWANWIDVQNKNLKDEVARPLFMLEETDKKIPWLTDIANAGVMGEMVTAYVAKGQTPEQAMQAGQDKALKIAASAKTSLKRA